jgi:hypothetical protein
VTAQAGGCKRCWVADCGVYGLPASTSNPLALSCAWPPCHRAFPPRLPEQPRHQSFRTRCGEVRCPQRKRRCPVAAGRSAAQQVDTGADCAQTWRPANITLFSFKNRGRSGHTTVASAATRLARRLHSPTNVSISLPTASAVTGAKSAASNVRPFYSRCASETFTSISSLARIGRTLGLISTNGHLLQKDNFFHIALPSPF